MAKEVLVDDIGLRVSADTNVLVSVGSDNSLPIRRHNMSIEHRHMACNHQHTSGRGQQGHTKKISCVRVLRRVSHESIHGRSLGGRVDRDRIKGVARLGMRRK